MKRISILGALVLVALALPTAGGESRKFDRGFSFAPREHRVGVKTGPVGIESLYIGRWPDPGDFRKGERNLDDTHTCRIEFRYTNRDSRDWKCRYTVSVTSKGRVLARTESTETLGDGKVGKTHSFGLKMRTHEYKLAD
ncbi:MAG: hypothetical protein ABIT01_12890, partial [Thermoanaerobaculia bacterium]